MRWSSAGSRRDERQTPNAKHKRQYSKGFAFWVLRFAFGVCRCRSPDTCRSPESNDMRQSRLAELSVKKPVTMTMLFCAILAVGALAYTRIPIQLLPGGFTPPFLFVRVPYRNGTPREVEKYVTRP